MVLVLKFQKQVDRLAVSGLIWEASCVYLPLDGGVPVILHSIVRPVGKHRGPRHVAPERLEAFPTLLQHIPISKVKVRPNAL